MWICIGIFVEMDKGSFERITLNKVDFLQDSLFGIFFVLFLKK
jgi:hypothetical protein